MYLFDTVISLTRSVTSTNLTRKPFSPRWFTHPRIFKGEIRDKDGPAILTGLFPSDTRGETPSHNTCLVYDIDKTDKETFRDCLGSLRADGYEWLVHSTTQHTPDNPRYRLYLPLVEPLEPDKYSAVSKALAKRYEIPCAPESHVASIPMFLPLCTPEGIKHYKYLTNEGEPVDGSAFDDELDLEVPDDWLDEGLGRLPIPDGIDEQTWVRLILSSYPPAALDQDKWKDVVLALGHHFDGSDLGFRIFLDWQHDDGNNPQYNPEDEKEVERWRKRYESGRPRVGIRPYTLKAIANIKSKHGVSVLGRAYAAWLDLKADEDGVMSVLHEAAADPFCNGQANARLITTRYRKKADSLRFEVELKPAEVEALIQSDAPLAVESDVQERFYDRYVFMSWSNDIYDLLTCRAVSIQVFNQLYQHEMPTKPRSKGARHKPYDVVVSGMFGYRPLRTVIAECYEVNGPPLVERDGDLRLNLFQQGSWPTVEREFDASEPIDGEIERMVTRHFNLIGDGDSTAAAGMLAWLAHTRQHPGLRSYWGVSLLSVMGGIGKTSFRELARCVLGAPQVNMILPKDLNDQFNTFVHKPHLITFIEEPDYKANTSIHRFDIDSLKSLITDDQVSTRLMRVGAELMDVYSQFAITGNNEHAMGTADTGRRWLTSIIAYRTDADVAAMLGCPADVFFARYYQLMAEHPERFVAYFESIDLSDHNRNKPPLTEQKRQEKELKPLRLISNLITELAESGVHFDLHTSVVYLPAADDIVLNYARADDNPLLDNFCSKYSRKARYEILRDALTHMGYAPLALGVEGPVRIEFEKSKRPRPGMVFVERSIFEGDDPLRLPMRERVDAVRKVMSGRQSANRLSSVAL